MFLEQSEKYNFLPRINEPLSFALESRVMLLTHNPSAIDVDITVAGLPFEEDSILNATSFEINALIRPLPKPEDLIIMKTVAPRPTDLIDIESLIDANPKLNYQSITMAVKEFADARAMPELSENIHKILSRKQNKVIALNFVRPHTQAISNYRTKSCIKLFLFNPHWVMQWYYTLKNANQCNGTLTKATNKKSREPKVHSLKIQIQQILPFLWQKLPPAG